MLTIEIRVKKRGEGGGRTNTTSVFLGSFMQTMVCAMLIILRRRCCERDGTRWANKGIDIMCSAGSRVYAPFPARVLYSYRPFLKNRRPYNVAIRLRGTGAWKGKTWTLNLTIDQSQMF